MTDYLHPSFTVLLIDDEPAWLHGMAIALERAGINHLRQCPDSRETLPLLAREDVGLVLLDLVMPHLSGEDLLIRIVQDHPETAVIVISGLDQVDTAVRCMQAGAVDYFVKTAEEDRLVAGAQRAIRMLELMRENRRLRTGILREKLEHPETFEGIITANAAMRSIFHYVEAVAHSSQPVLISGESGTGKELVALAVHRASRPEGPWIPVNVAGLDDNVFADTLFGHVRGAFTGADQPRRGMVELAIGGTLFLDEIGDLSQASQMKLLRLLQDGEYCPLGSEKCRRSNARIVVATNQDLAAKVAAGLFRKDLYFRLKAHCLDLPPLRRRPEDIPLLLEHFLAEAASELGKEVPIPPPQLPDLLASYPFPGNVRELRSMVFDALSLHPGGRFSLEPFRRAMGLTDVGPEGAEKDAVAKHVGPVLTYSERLPTFKEALRLLTAEAIRRSHGNRTLAARLLGISRPALSKRLKKMAEEAAPKA
jgi:DNA-binding NtrC family response regulator